MALLGMALPYLPLAGEAFGLVPLNPGLVAATVGIALAYAAATEVAKRSFHRMQEAAMGDRA